MGWLPRNTFTALRNAVVVSVGGGKATITIDGGDATGIPIYGGSPKAGDKVLVAVQGDQMVVLGAGGQQTAGSAYGTVAASVPVGAATQLGITSEPGAVSVTGGGAGPLVLGKTGFWLLTVAVSGYTGVASGVRAFASIRVDDGTKTHYLRNNVGAGEDRLTVSGGVRAKAGTEVVFDCYNAGSAMTATGFYTVKYMGAT